MTHLKTRERLATGMVRPRTTALFLDKLWVHPALMEGNLFGSMETLTLSTFTRPNMMKLYLMIVRD